MLLPPLLLATLAIPLAAQVPGAEPEARAARKIPADSTWSQGQGAAQATDAVRGWDLAVSERGLRVSPAEAASDTEEQTWNFLIGTASFGRVGAAEAVTLGQPNARGERVDLDHGPLSEWFVRGEHGVEHGWTIPSAPEGDAKVPLWIGLRIEGDLSMHIVDDGSGAFLRDARGVLRLRYTGLKTFDASGAVLPSKLMASPFGVGVRIDAEGAAYPITVDPLIVPEVWVFQTDQDNASDGIYGFRTTTAGDVNGDGYSDVLVIAPVYNGTTGVDEGRAWVFLGSPSGPGPYTSPDWIAEGGVSGGHFGYGGGSAGDLNGDGFDDIVIASTHGRGKIHVWYGSASGLGPNGTPGNADFTYESPFNSSRFRLGQAACDVNGDGYGDIVMGSWSTFGDPERAWVFLGGPSGIVPSATNPWIDGGSAQQADAGFGWVATSAGDVNADGYDDIVVGAPYYDFAPGPGGGDNGRVLGFYGGPSFATDHIPDWEVSLGPIGPAFFGIGLAGVGDSNGDGYADVAVGATNDNVGGPSEEGVVRVYHGGPGGLSTTLNGRREGIYTGVKYGYSIATAGDIDGDGSADFVVGAVSGTAQIWVVNGRSGGIGLLTSFGDQNLGVPYGLYSGSDVASAGDVNGDGFGDVLASCFQYSGGQTMEGAAVLFLGSPSPQSGGPFALAEQGALQPGSPSSRTGRSVSSAGDVNADGFNDVVVGSPDFGASDNGRVQVFLGSANGLNLASPFWTFDSTNTGENFGWSVSAGDIDNDGKSDIVVGAPNYSNGQTDEGRVYLFKSLGGSISATPNWSVESNQAGSLFGSAVSALGDVNADGFGDIAVGAPGATSGQGSVTIFHGRATSLAAITAAITITSGVPGSEFGTALALVGDVNLDGFGDLAVGAPKIDDPQVDEGRVYVYLGSYSGITGVVGDNEESNQAGALLGSSLAQCGDVNGDGRAEILVGTPGYDAATSGGGVFLYQAQPAGAGISLVSLAFRGGSQAGSQYGVAVSAGGDVNGDGWNDVLVGAPDFDGALADQGRIYMYLGSSSGLAATPSETYDGPLPNTRFGESIALGGDVNGDGLSDPIGGVPSANNDDGGVFPLVGGGNTAWRVNSSQRQVSDAQALQILGRTNETNQFQMNLGVQNSGGNTATAMGRAPVKLEWEIQPVGSILDGSTVQEQVSFTNSGNLGSGLRLLQNVVGLLDGTAYHWRARTVVRNPYYPHTRWTTIQLDGLQEKKLGMSADCNGNGIGDPIDVAVATSLDCNGDTIPDECQVPPLGNTFADCNANLVPDVCEVADPFNDCDGNQIPDDCDPDCNGNFVADACDISGGSSFDTNGDTIPDECQPGGSTFCFGDGTGAACPCANSSPAGNQDGCLNSLGVGGRLRASGVARVAFDNFTLLGTGMPNSSALYFQGTAQQSTGNGAPFGDGKRCAAGTIVRLGTKNNTGGGSQYPAGADLRISLKGLIPAGGGTRYYQVWYRNAAAYCTISTFNLTNGWQVTWIP